ncbi:MAG TPA: hypothetical protein VF068_07490 [Rubrobacter sp.]
MMRVLGFRKGTIGGDPHPFYCNRHFVYALRRRLMYDWEAIEGR